MMKLFKKKKSDTKLPMMANTNQLVTDPMPIYKKPTHLTVMDNEQPTIVMPKPRRVITPTRKILTRFDNDKTQVEEQEYLDRSLLSLPTHEVKHMTSHDHYQTVTVASEDDTSSRVYESALESLSPAYYKTITSGASEATEEQPSTASATPRYNKENKMDETQMLLQELKNKVLLMEQQQAIDRAEWQRKERELLENRDRMMEEIIQLNLVLKQDEQRLLHQRSKSEEHLSRHNSIASSHSQSTTLVSTAVPHHYHQKNNRQRSKSIDSSYARLRKSASRASLYYEQPEIYNYEENEEEDDDIDDDNNNYCYYNTYYYHKPYPYLYQHNQRSYYPIVYSLSRQRHSYLN
ncbi:hypothetical protein RMCBS344292_06671 [Rhizopus microsporus]|nr:hypothetical protein RMCBS344292_06671 [Rhizopus microsporus]